MPEGLSIDVDFTGHLHVGEGFGDGTHTTIIASAGIQAARVSLCYGRNYLETEPQG